MDGGMDGRRDGWMEKLDHPGILYK